MAAITALATLLLPLTACVYFNKYDAPSVALIPPAPETRKIDLTKDGVVVFRVKVDKDTIREFKESLRNMFWVLADSGELIAQFRVDHTRLAVLNAALTTGHADLEVPGYADPAQYTRLKTTHQGRKKLDVLLVLDYGPKATGTISGTAYRHAISVPVDL